MMGMQKDVVPLEKLFIVFLAIHLAVDLPPNLRLCARPDRPCKRYNLESPALRPDVTRAGISDRLELNVSA